MVLELTHVKKKRKCFQIDYNLRVKNKIILKVDIGEYIIQEKKKAYKT